MIGSLPKPKRNANYGKQPRANPLLRAWRMAKRKRIALARLGAARALHRAQAKVDRTYALAAIHDVPIEPMAPLPMLPGLPGSDWIEVRRAMGVLREPVRPVPAAEPQAAGATS